MNAMIASCSGGPPHRIEDRLAARAGGGALPLLPWGLRELEKVIRPQRRAAPPREDMACSASPKVWHRVRHGSWLAAVVRPLLVDGRLPSSGGSLGGSCVAAAASERWPP